MYRFWCSIFLPQVYTWLPGELVYGVLFPIQQAQPVHVDKEPQAFLLRPRLEAVGVDQKGDAVPDLGKN